MEYELMRIVGFLNGKWNEWESLCEPSSDSNQEIHQEIGGEE
ncbi:hypothetical protein [Citrobacter freundii]|nr:hypothetical protein [Citrobacter freundii]